MAIRNAYEGIWQMNETILAALIALGGIVIGVVLEHIFYGRRKFNQVIAKIGDTGGKSVMYAISEADEGIRKAIRDTGDATKGAFGSADERIRQSVGATDDVGSLTHQHEGILKAVERINMRNEESDRKTAALYGQGALLAEALETVVGFESIYKDIWDENMRLNARIQTLESEMERLKGRTVGMAAAEDEAEDSRPHEPYEDMEI
jgi:hypothetical protein